MHSYPASTTAGSPPRRATHDKSDEALIAKIASGNRLAMQVLFARHHTRVYRFILRLVGDGATADDLTSEVFLAVWRQARRFEARSAAATWLLAIARNKALAELRRRREPLPDIEDMMTNDPPPDPEAAFAIKRRGEILRKCLTRLSREQREIIDLVYYHEKSVQEVADIVGILCNTVKTRMFYARRRLSQLLARHGVVRASV
jgi:RNA polymerase sigma-70 factor (ECF subfamily)